MQRSRQTPQRKSRFPSRSICTSMHSSVSSTLVTAWAFKRNCFLIKVSMSTSARVLSYSLVGNTKLTRCRGALQIPVRPQLQSFKGLQLPLHFSERNLKSKGHFPSIAVEATRPGSPPWHNKLGVNVRKSKKLAQSYISFFASSAIRRRRARTVPPRKVAQNTRLAATSKDIFEVWPHDSAGGFLRA